MTAKQHILVIDDHSTWVETLSDYLQAKGYEVQATHEAGRGLDMAQHPLLNLVIVDYHLPDMTGLEFLRALRRKDENISVLLFSSDAEPTLPQRALQAGANAFISKSAPPPVILRSILNALWRLPKWPQPWPLMLPYLNDDAIRLLLPFYRQGA